MCRPSFFLPIISSNPFKSPGKPSLQTGGAKKLDQSSSSKAIDEMRKIELDPELQISSAFAGGMFPRTFTHWTNIET